jgi:hypothetical protein
MKSVLAGRLGVEAQIELIFPAKLEACFRERFIPKLRHDFADLARKEHLGPGIVHLRDVLSAERSPRVLSAIS